MLSALAHRAKADYWAPDFDSSMLIGIGAPLRMIAAVAGLISLSCDKVPVAPLQPTLATVRIVFLGSTTRRSDLPVSAQGCIAGVGATHIHPSWRSFAGIPLQADPPDRYEITFNDVPVATRVSFRINDQNSCDENATGAVTRNVFANDVRLAQNTTTPGNGDEPSYALTIAANGAITNRQPANRAQWLPTQTR
jgi:hypothetical protein